MIMKNTIRFERRTMWPRGCTTIGNEISFNRKTTDFVCLVILSSETVVKKLSTAWKTDVLMGNLLRVMREHVMTQYKHYQLYMHAAVTVIKCLARVM